MAQTQLRFAVLLAGLPCACSGSPQHLPTKTLDNPAAKRAVPIAAQDAAKNQIIPSDGDPPVDDSNKAPDKVSQNPVPEAAEDTLSASMDDEGSNRLLVGDLQFNDVSIAVKIGPPKEGKPVVAQLHSKGFKKRLRLGFTNPESADSIEISATELPAFSNPKLVMIQLFQESGEDAFSRSIVTALVFLGDKKSAPTILWRGEGSYQSYSGQCQIIDVVHFAPEGTTRASIMREQATIVDTPENGEWENGDAEACTAVPTTLTRIGGVTIP